MMIKRVICVESKTSVEFEAYRCLSNRRFYSVSTEGLLYRHKVEPLKVSTEGLLYQQKVEPLKVSTEGLLYRHKVEPLKVSTEGLQDLPTN